MDLSAAIMWVGLGLSEAEPHALWFLCTCQFDIETVDEFRSLEIQHSRHGTTNVT